MGSVICIICNLHSQSASSNQRQRTTTTTTKTRTTRTKAKDNENQEAGYGHGPVPSCTLSPGCDEIGIEKKILFYLREVVVVERRNR